MDRGPAGGAFWASQAAPYVPGGGDDGECGKRHDKKGGLPGGRGAVGSAD